MEEDVFRSLRYGVAAQGATLKDMELVKWLDGKMTDLDGWSGRAGAALVSKEMVSELELCFQSLDAPVKLKIVESFVHVNPRFMPYWKDEIKCLLSISCRDPDDWVEVISDMYKQVPDIQRIVPNPVTENMLFKKAMQDTFFLFRSHDALGNLQIFPRSYDVCSSVVKEQFGLSRDQPVHFKLRKQPKSYLLKKEVEKQREQLISLSKMKNGGIISNNVPIKLRSTLRTDKPNLPMRGIPTETSKISGGFTNEPKKFQRSLPRRDGGVKMLEFTEIPQSLKMRRQAAAEEDKKKKLEEKENARKKALDEKRQKEEQRKAELIRQAEEARKKQEKKMIEEQKTKEKADAETRQKQEEVKPTKLTPSSNTDVKSPSLTTLLSPRIRTTSSDLGNDNSSQQARPQQQMVIGNLGPGQQIVVHTQEPQHMQGQATMHFEHSDAMNIPPGGQRVIHASEFEEMQRKQAEEAIVTQCNDMLRTANALDPNGRALVMDFMRGNKMNPRPQLGNLITLKLSENVENGVTEGHACKMKVETFFQMDYSNGEWKRLRKCRMLTPDEIRRYESMGQESFVQQQNQNTQFIPAHQFQQQSQQQQYQPSMTAHQQHEMKPNHRGSSINVASTQMTQPLSHHGHSSQNMSAHHHQQQQHQMQHQQRGMQGSGGVSDGNQHVLRGVPEAQLRLIRTLHHQGTAQQNQHGQMMQHAGGRDSAQHQGLVRELLQQSSSDANMEEQIRRVTQHIPHTSYPQYW